jgi:hypothetical protein
MDYSRNLLFQSGQQMGQVFQALIDRSRAPPDLDRVKNDFRRQQTPHRDRSRKNPSRRGVAAGKPDYDTTIF